MVVAKRRRHVEKQPIALPCEGGVVRYTALVPSVFPPQIFVLFYHYAEIIKVGFL